MLAFHKLKAGFQADKHRKSGEKRRLHVKVKASELEWVLHVCGLVIQNLYSLDVVFLFNFFLYSYLFMTIKCFVS